MVDSFTTPYTVDVSQFGADNNNVERYKQAAEYAKDAEFWANKVKEGVATADDLLKIVQDLYEKGEIIAADIEALKAQFLQQNETLMGLISEANSAAANANNAVSVVNQKIIEINQQLDIIKRIHVTVTEIPPTETAKGSYDVLTGEIHLDIPKGNPGKDGSVADLSNTTTGVPNADDFGFYVNKSDSTVHKALMSDIAKTFPSVTSVTQGAGAPEKGDVVVSPSKIGLGNVLNVASYSKAESDSHVKGFIKPYRTKAAADLDAPSRTVGEKVLVWNDYTFDLYEIVAGATPTDPNKLGPTPVSEKRLRTINGLPPDNVGNVQLTVPSGNPSLYIGEMIMFPYDPANTISYNGVVPADGRQIRRDVETTLVSDLKSGNVKIVSDTEWRNGAKMYFSWGLEDDGTTDGTETTGTYIRMPDWTGGEAIRTPDKVGDSGYKGAAFNQAPYITKINSKDPDVATGVVTLSASDINALPLTGTAEAAKKLATARKISGIAFDGTQDIVLSATDVNALPVGTRSADIQGAAVTSAGVVTNISETSQPLKIPNAVLDFHAASLGQVNATAAQIRTDVIPVSRGGTGATTADTGRAALSAAKSGTNTDITALNGLATQITIAQGGTGSSSPFGNIAGKFAQGNDPRLNNLVGKGGGDITGNLSVTGASTFTGNVNIEGQNLNLRSTTPSGGWPYFISFQAGQGNNLTYSRVYGENGGDVTISTGVNADPKYFSFSANGDFQAPRNIQCVALTQTSDATKKDDIEPIGDALNKLSSLDGVTFKWKATGMPSAGVIAQQVKEVLPEAIGSSYDDRDEYSSVDEEVVVDEIVDGILTKVKKTVSTVKLVKRRDDSKRSYTVEYSGVLALAIQAIKELSSKVDKLEKYIGPEKLAAMEDSNS